MVISYQLSVALTDKLVRIDGKDILEDGMDGVDGKVGSGREVSVEKRRMSRF